MNTRIIYGTRCIWIHVSDSPILLSLTHNLELHTFVVLADYCGGHNRCLGNTVSSKGFIEKRWKHRQTVPLDYYEIPQTGLCTVSQTIIDHWSHMTTEIWSTLAHIMSRCQTAPNNYLNQCWIVTNVGMSYSLKYQFHSKCSKCQFVKWVWKIHLWNYFHLSQGLIS